MPGGSSGLDARYKGCGLCHEKTDTDWRIVGFLVSLSFVSWLRIWLCWSKPVGSTGLCELYGGGEKSAISALED